MIEKVRLKAQIIWYFPSILNVVKITRPLRSYRTPNIQKVITLKSDNSMTSLKQVNFQLLDFLGV